ncbi:MAG: transposase [Opitutaceae bacterium]|nr:transposase [Opitutaceae bacterium]
MSRTVNSERLFTESDCEILRDLIWKVADFCGVKVVTYAILSNHFHVLVRVPKKAFVPDEEVVRRYASLYPTPSQRRPEYLPVIEQHVREQSPQAEAWLVKQRNQMGDLSEYMKLLKQRFTGIFNVLHDRHGTLWSERFKSVLVEDGRALHTMAVYIDLNPVRAGLVSDPKDYRFCGYAEAVAGSKLAQQGLCTVTEEHTWEEAASSYRQSLFGRAGKPSRKGERISAEVVDRVFKENGKLPHHVVLTCRIRYFTNGAVLGSRNFVAQELAKLKKKYGRVRALEPMMLPPITDWGPIMLLRRCRAGICPA